jgi:hypothetical protein
VTLPDRHPPRDASPKTWLASRQNHDGSWGEGAAQLETTSLAVLALTEGAIEPAWGDGLDLARGWLGRQGEGRRPAGVRAQALSTCALAGLARMGPEAREPLRASGEALVRAQGRNGWPARTGGSFDPAATAWAVTALVRARAAGADSAGWERRAADACARLAGGGAGAIRIGDPGPGWPSAVAAGCALAQLARAEEGRRLAGASLDALPDRLAAGTLDEGDPESLALLALWAGRDPLAVPPASAASVRAAVLRWRLPSTRRWGSAAGEVRATALASWLLDLCAPR